MYDKKIVDESAALLRTYLETYFSQAHAIDLDGTCSSLKDACDNGDDEAPYNICADVLTALYAVGLRNDEKMIDSLFGNLFGNGRSPGEFEWACTLDKDILMPFMDNYCDDFIKAINNNPTRNQGAVFKAANGLIALAFVLLCETKKGEE